MPNVTFVDFVCGVVKSAFKRHFLGEKIKRDEKDEKEKKAGMSEDEY